MSNITYQLELLGFPPEIKQHASNLSLDKLNAFINKHISSLILKYGLPRVQSSIDSDNNPNSPVIKFITSLMEIGMLHELFHQSFASINSNVLNQRLEYLAWAINISVATNLKENGVMRIPAIANGQINIYYTWDNMEIIIRRIMPIASQIDGAVPDEVNGYIDNLINENLR